MPQPSDAPSGVTPRVIPDVGGGEGAVAAARRKGLVKNVRTEPPQDRLQLDEHGGYERSLLRSV